MLWIYLRVYDPAVNPITTVTIDNLEYKLGETALNVVLNYPPRQYRGLFVLSMLLNEDGTALDPNTF